MKTSLISTVVLIAALAAGPEAQGGSIFESDAELTPENEIDKLVLDRLQQLGIQPAKVCSDEVFVRRVYLDVIGTLPTSKETREFLSDEDPDKRRALIDRLLEREAFADYWAMKWGDLLRVKAEFPINLWPNAVQTYHRWIRTSIKKNVPYDRFVREMLTASGSNFRVPPVNFYRALQDKQPAGIARTVSLTFMGTRAEKWPQDRLSGMAAFFTHISYKPTGEWKEEVVQFDPEKKASQSEGSAPAAAVFPDGTPARLSPNQDPRQVFADWLIAPENPWFTRNIANRTWSWLLGRGIIHEPDDIRPDNPPSNPELLAFLEKELIAAKYDVKHLYRLILNSKTYQLACVPRTEKPEGPANFAYYPLRRLEAEVLIDAINQITGATEKYSSPIPEPFTFIPENQRSIALADGSITSSFLDMFGRSSRDTGLESERNNRPSAAQWLHLLNSSHIQRKIEQGPKLRPLLQYRKDSDESVTEIYLTILSRRPTEEELKAARAYGPSGGKGGRQAKVDLVWALINSAEFLYRH